VNRSGKVPDGVGFVAELQSLFYPHFDTPRADAATQLAEGVARLVADHHRHHSDRSSREDHRINCRRAWILAGVVVLGALARTDSSAIALPGLSRTPPDR